MYWGDLKKVFCQVLMEWANGRDWLKLDRFEKQTIECEVARRMFLPATEQVTTAQLTMAYWQIKQAERLDCNRAAIHGYRPTAEQVREAAMAQQRELQGWKVAAKAAAAAGNETPEQRAERRAAQALAEADQRAKESAEAFARFEADIPW